MALLEEGGADCHVGGNEAVMRDASLRSDDVDRSLRSELQQINCNSIKTRVTWGVDVEILGGPPSKSVVLDVASECNVRGLFSCCLIGLSLMGQSFPSTSKFSGTDYCISELESLVRKKAEEPVVAHVCVGSAVRFCLPSRSDAQPGLGTGQTTYCPSNSIRTLLKVYFSGNPTTDNDPRQQTTGFSAGQMIQFARATGLEESQALCGI